MRTPRSIAIRNKARGKELERKIVKMCHEREIKAERAWGSNGRALGLTEDVDVVVDDMWYFQCKKTARLRKDFIPSENVNGVIIEGNRLAPMVLFKMTDFLVLIQNLAILQKQVGEMRRQLEEKRP